MDKNINKEFLENCYQIRFGDDITYRNRVWQILTGKFFSKHVQKDSAILDLGCGRGEFVNHIQARKKYAMDLNPENAHHLEENVTFLEQDCAKSWQLDDASLDVVFTSNFLEHLFGWQAVESALLEVKRCLKPGGKVIIMGPNIKYLGGHYWDFWDHRTPLTESSLAEILTILGFSVDLSVAKFLPFTMSRKFKPPVFLMRLYLGCPLFWRIFGKQFLIVAGKS